jgi:hypothetical protein
LEQTVPIVLAARLFAHERWLRENDPGIVINVDRADPLTLKWAALLAGYGRAPSNLFHPSHENAILLGELNLHPAAEVSEYSVWAFWQNPQYEISDLRIPLHSLSHYPDNVRRWINRLITKDESFVSTNLGLFDHLWEDEATNAREGLALGIRQLYVPELDEHVLDWHDHESEDSIRELLLEHMAFSSPQSEHYSDIVQEQFLRAGRFSGIRKRLLAASEGKELYSKLRLIDLRDEVHSADLFIPRQAEGPPIMIMGDVNVSPTNFNAGRDITGQNLVGGDMIGSANAAIQSMPSSQTVEQTALTELVRFLETAKGLSNDNKSKVLRR